MKLHLSLAAILTPLALTGEAFANGSRLPTQDNEAAARGYADVATAENPSAVYSNPAGLAQEKSATYENNLYVIAPSYSFTGTSGAATSANKKTFVTPAFFAAIPLQAMNGKELAVGLGLFSPFGLSSNWPDTSPFRTLATYNEIRYYTSSVSLAVPVTQTLTIGGSLEYNSNRVDLNRGVGYTPGDRFHYVGNGHALSYNLGFQWQPSTQHSFGLLFHSKTDFSINGQAHLDPFGITYAGHADWAYPENVSVGYSWRPTDLWNLEADYDWTNWSRLKTVVLYSPTAAPTALPFNWTASHYINVGGTRRFDNGFFASAGVSYSSNSIPQSSFNPSLPDVSRYLYNVGGGYAYRHWKVSGLIQLGSTEKRTVTGSPYGLADGVFTNKLAAFGVTTLYRY